ncbi:MAG: sugar porter family MFS transporter, partial [Mycobacteriaceae bacterium]|nr:sugar porter family MFS transporter [Mycobacteriaceae bacterium]
PSQLIAAHHSAAAASVDQAKITISRPLLIAIGAALIDTLVGVGAIVYYSTDVFAMAGVGGHSGAEVASLSIGLINVISTVAAVRLLGRYGRRPLLTVGLTGIVLALVTTGCSLLWPAPGAWIVTIAAMLVFMACHAFSAGPIGWLLVAEVLPARIRSRGSAVAIGANWSATLLVTLLFPVLVGSPGSPDRAALGFFIFAVITIGFLIFVRVCVPETKGLTLDEVEATLAGHHKKAKQ